MASDTDKKKPSDPGSSLDVQPQPGEINPSSPTVGTEGWGVTSDERRVLAGNQSGATRAGQMKGNPGDHMTATAQRESDRATTNERPEKEGASQDLSQHTSASAHSMHSHGGSASNFRCADAGKPDCRGETSGDSDDEVVRRAEEHWRQDHGMSDWTEATRDKVRNQIRHRKAA